MDGMIAAAESQSAEADSEPVAQVETAEESTSNVQSSETLAENVPSQPAPSESAEPAESIPDEAPGDLAAPDHVSSSTESYPGRNGLPSINHQSVLIPNMEPYLEEGSLDGAPKEFQDPSSSNSNPPSDSDSKTAIDSSNQPDTPQDSVGPPPESSPADEDSSHINEPEVEEPVATLPEAESNPQLEESPPLEPSNSENEPGADQVSSLMEQEPPVQEEVGNSSVPVEDVNGVDSSTVEAPPPPPPEDQEQPSESNVEEEEEPAQVESEPAIDSSSYAVASNEPDESNVEEAADPAPIEEAAPTDPPSDEQQYEEEQQEQYPVAESSDGAVPVEPATVCEADSSAAGMEEAAAGYDPDEMDSSQQNVYVVEGEQQSGSLTPFHNSETAMLVEMAPLATESYVNSQVQYVETGQEGMITDAQAAELLMRVSEQRPFQQDPGSTVAGGPYVQVQLAQTVEGITHLVEVPVSALANYCLQPSTLVYTTPGGASGSGTTEMATWQVMETTDHHHHQQPTSNSKFSDIVSASIEAIGFPESVTPGANILSHAEQILTSGNASGVQEVTANFDFDDNSSSNSSLTLQNHSTTTATYPRPKRESIESRIHRLLRGANAPVPEGTVVEEPQLPSPKTVKLAQLQTRSPVIPSAPATVTLNLPKRPSRLDSNLNNASVRTVTIPAVFTAAAAVNKPAPLPPGSSDYFMPRGMSKRKAQGAFKPSKVNPSKPGCIDAEPAPPEETKVKLVMNNDTMDDVDQLREDDEYNRAVLLQARQRKQQTEHVSVKLDNNHLSSSKYNSSASPRSVLLSLPSTNNKEDNSSEASPAGGPAPSKRVRLSFPPDIYANLEEEISSAYMAELQTPKLTYTMPRARQAKVKSKESAGIDNLIKSEPKSEISVRLPWMVEEESEEELRRKNRTIPPRIIRQNSSIKSDATPSNTKIHEDEDIGADEELVEDSGQVIVIGLDESGNQPSEEQLTAIIQAAMTKRESSSPEKPKPVRSSQMVGTSPKSLTPTKRKAAPANDDENGVEAEENGVRMKVIRTYDRNVGVLPRRKPPRSKKLSSFSIEIFDYDEEEEEEDDGEEVDDLAIFSKDLADEEEAIREKEKLVAQSKSDSPATSGRGRRGRGAVRGAARRGRGRPKKEKSGSEEEEQLAFEDDSNDEDFKPTRGRGRGGRGSRSRGRAGRRGGGRQRVAFKEEVEEEEEMEEEEEEDDDEEEERIPGMPSKPCPQCDERFTTRQGFLDHIVTHSSAKCLVCGWKNTAPKDKSRIRQHMSTSHAGLLPK